MRRKLNKLERKVRTLAKDTKDLRHTEFFIPYSASGNMSYNTGALVVDTMANLTPGDQMYNEFEGRTIMKKRLQAKFTIEAGSSEHDECRVIVWVEKEVEDGVAPTSLNEILHQSGQLQVHSGWNQVNSGQYKILYDKRFILTKADHDPSATQVVTSATPHYKMFDINIPIKRKYQESAWHTGHNAFVTNRIFIGMISNSAVIPHPGPTDYGGGNGGMGMLFYDS